MIDLVENRIRGLPSSRSPSRLEGWKIVPWSELKPHIDVFEVDGKERIGLFVSNNPINYVDPFGFLTELLTFSGAGSGRSFFGHTAININGTTYSFGERGWFTEPTKDFMNRNNFRSAYGADLKLTPEEEKALKDYLDDQVKNNKDPFNVVGKTCTIEAKRGLEKVVGRPLTNMGPTPWQLLLDLKSEGLINKINFYPKGGAQ